MYEKFNMGMGFFILCKRKDARAIMRIVDGDGDIVGKVRSGPKKTILLKDGKEIEFLGY